MTSKRTEYYSLNLSETARELRTSEKGLSRKEARERLQQYGYNELKKEEDNKALKIFLGQFKNAFIFLLIFAGILSLLLGETLEPIAIFGIVLFNAFLGFVQEYRAERAVESLQKLAANTSRVLRDGKDGNIPARELVPGDYVLLEAGDVVPADVRLSEAASLQIDEASLTGESVPSKKTTDPLKSSIIVAEQVNMVFAGTVVTYGKGSGYVVATGAETEFGKIAESLKSTKETLTPLQVKFGHLAKQIGLMAAVIISVVFVALSLHGTLSLSEMLLFALALTVSTIPNSLPVIVTVSLSLGAKRLADKKMLVKKLPAAESLGAVTVICSDKTGTLTKNEMTVTDVYFGGRAYKVSGAGYEPSGDFKRNGMSSDAAELEPLLRIGLFCNNARLTETEGRHEIIGDPTEGSLIVLAKKGGLGDRLRERYHFVEELPFDSDRKRMSVIYLDKEKGSMEAYVKGAPDMLIGECDRILVDGKVRPITESDRSEVMRVNDAYARGALRVLGMAYRELDGAEERTIENVERGLVFAGLVGMIDPPREEVLPAVKKCRNAGIKVLMITGDHVVTAKAIAEQIGMYHEGDLVLTGKEISQLSDDELEYRIDEVSIIARALPIQKSRIVSALQKRGHIVAMTGDGVNDAPALKKADVGIAMGITGTGVAKEVSEAILVDDNFASIVNAVEEGRDIYNKMIKSARYLLSCNCGEITCVFTAIMLKFPIPLLPLQILLMNILTDDFPALGLGSEPSDKNVMNQPPRNPKERPITKKMFISIGSFGLIMGLGTLYVFSTQLDEGLPKAQTVAFTTLVMFQMFAVMSSRTLEPSLSHLNPLTNLWLVGAVCLSLLIQVAVVYLPPLQAMFGTVPLTASEWAGIIGVSFIGFVMMEISKLFIHATVKNNRGPMSPA